MNINPDQPISTCPLCLCDEMPEVHSWDTIEYDDVVPAKRVLCEKCKEIWTIGGFKNGRNRKREADLSLL